MKDQELRNGLYIVATPIGNLADISQRAIHTLTEVDWIAAEDTRHSIKLLNELEIKKPLHSFHEHSPEQKIQELLQLLQSGKKGAYISDAGTPGISDPGARLVEACHAVGIPVCPIPGASALTALLSVSGFGATGFRFHGFFPRGKKEREAWMDRASSEGGVHVFYESPFRVKETIATLNEKFPDQKIALGRELTKKFETVAVLTVKEMVAEITSKEPKGEFVFALELPEPEAGAKAHRKNPDDFTKLFEELAKLGASQKMLLVVAQSHGFKRSEVYDLLLEISKKSLTIR